MNAPFKYNYFLKSSQFLERELQAYNLHTQKFKIWMYIRREQEEINQELSCQTTSPRKKNVKNVIYVLHSKFASTISISWDLFMLIKVNVFHKEHLVWIRSLHHKRGGTLKILRALKLTLRKILFHRLWLELPCAWFQSVGPAVWAPGQSMGRLYAIKVTIKESTFNSMDCSEL